MQTPSASSSLKSTATRRFATLPKSLSKSNAYTTLSIESMKNIVLHLEWEHAPSSYTVIKLCIASPCKSIRDRNAIHMRLYGARWRKWMLIISIASTLTAIARKVRWYYKPDCRHVTLVALGQARDPSFQPIFDQTRTLKLNQRFTNSRCYLITGKISSASKQSMSNQMRLCLKYK